MEKREQRARRDRRRDGKRSTYQNEQGKETVKQQDSAVEEKKNDAQNVDVTNKKNASENKEKIIEDDPLRFANLKRETDEIAALKAKKPQKRQVFSNWSKYEEPLPSLDESRAVDFETLLHAPQSGSFRFKSEQHWDTGSYGRFGELFTPDVELLVAGLSSLPFYVRLGIDKTLFSEDEIEMMDRSAKENSVLYEKLSKSKPKRKVAATDLFKIDQAEKYSVVDQINEPTVESVKSTSKPVFSVEETPETTVQSSLPALAASSSVEPSNHTRESMPVSELAPEGATRDLHFEKPPPASFSVTENMHSQAPSRDRTPLRDSGQGAVSPEFHFERAPPPSYASKNVKSPFHSRESTPAKEAAPTTLSRGPSGSRAPTSGGQFASREGTPDLTTLPIREREAEQNILNDHPSATEFSSTTVSLSKNVAPREGILAREREDSALQENSLVQNVQNDIPQTSPFASTEVKESLDKIPPKVEMPTREETPREPALQRNSVDSQDEQTHRKSPDTTDKVPELKSDENEQISPVSDSYSKKGGKSDVRKQEVQQKGGGRHGRRKKGQNSSARGGDQLRTEAGDVCGDTAEPEADCTTRAAPKGNVSEEPGHEEPRRAEGVKKKPERPPPPAVLQDRQQSPPPTPQPSPAPAVVQQIGNKVPQPAASKPEEPKPQQVSMPATSPENQAQPLQKKTALSTKVDPKPKEHSSKGRVDDDGLNFLMSLRGQKTGGVSEVEAAKSAAGATVSRSAIEEDEMKESQKPKPPPVIATEKKEDLEDWLDSMLDD